MATELPVSGKKRSSVGKYVLGCAAVGLLLVGMLVLVNWPALSRLGHTAAAKFAEFQQVQTALHRAYPAANIQIQHKVMAGVSGPTLSIGVTNSPKLRDLSGEALRREARTIATMARANLRDKNEYQHFEVRVATVTGGSVSFSSVQSFLFEAADLDRNE